METEMEYTERSGLLEAKPTPVTLAWKGLSYVIDEKVRPRGLAGLCNAQINQKTLINKVSGYVSPGHLLAIMGTSYGRHRSTRTHHDHHVCALHLGDCVVDVYVMLDRKQRCWKEVRFG